MVKGRCVKTRIVDSLKWSKEFAEQSLELLQKLGVENKANDTRQLIGEHYFILLNTSQCRSACATTSKRFVVKRPFASLRHLYAHIEQPPPPPDNNDNMGSRLE